MKRATIAPLTLLTVLAVTAAAQERRGGEAVATPADPIGRNGLQVAVPSPPPPDLGPHTASVPPRVAVRGRDSAGESSFKALQVREVTAGRARLFGTAGERTVRPGDVIEGATVRAIDPGRMVLARPAAGGQEDLIVVAFDAAGHARVRVYSAAIPAAAPARPVR